MRSVGDVTTTGRIDNDPLQDEFFPWNCCIPNKHSSDVKELEGFSCLPVDMHTPRPEDPKTRPEDLISRLEPFGSFGRNTIRAIAIESHLDTIQSFPIKHGSRQIQKQD